MRYRTFATLALVLTALSFSACSSEPNVSPEQQDARFQSILESTGFDPAEAQGLVKVGRLVCDNLGYGRTYQEVAAAVRSGLNDSSDTAAIIAAAETAYCPE